MQCVKKNTWDNKPLDTQTEISVEPDALFKQRKSNKRDESYISDKYITIFHVYK